VVAKKGSVREQNELLVAGDEETRSIQINHGAIIKKLKSKA
jgi:hypothetical protein